MLEPHPSAIEPRRVALGDARDAGSVATYPAGSLGDQLGFNERVVADPELDRLMWLVATANQTWRQRDRLRGASCGPVRRAARARTARRATRTASKSAAGSDDGEPPSDDDLIVVVIDAEGSAQIYVPVGDFVARFTGPVPESDEDFATLVDLAERAVAGDPSVRWVQ